MQKVKRYLCVITIVATVLALILGLAACSPKLSSEGSPSSKTQAKQVSGEGSGAYESDEKCLSCHGGSYEALAETTSSYGQSNPHDSIHGGYNSCGNCHAKDRELTDNQCLSCHDWPHNPETK